MHYAVMHDMKVVKLLAVVHMVMNLPKDLHIRCVSSLQEPYQLLTASRRNYTVHICSFVWENGR